MKQVLNRISEILMTVLVTVMILAVCWQVFARYVLNDPSGFTEELLRYALIWLTMVGGAYAYGKDKHMSVTIAVRKLSPSKKMKLRLIIDVTVIVLASLVMIYGGMMVTLNAVGQISAALGMPMPFLYLSLVVSGVMMIIYAIDKMVENVKTLKSQAV